MFNQVKMIAAAAAMFVTTVASAAAPVQVKFDSLPGYYTDTPGAFDNTVKFNINGTPFGSSVTADEMGLAIAGVSSSFAAYCLNPIIDLNLPGSYFINDVALDSVARLFKVSGFDGNKYTTDGVVGNTAQAALQLAIWEVALDPLSNTKPVYDLDSGVFTLTLAAPSTKSAAQALLVAAQGLAAGSYYPEVRTLISKEGNSQPMVTTVPEPSTYALIAACMGVIGMVSRRKSA
jgi:hypothetical protein